MKVLILRLSSLGDVVQCMSAVEGIKHAWPEGAEVHFLTKREFGDIVRLQSGVDKVITLPDALGPIALFKFFYKVLRSGEYTHVYDAHNNLRAQVFLLAHLATLFIPPRRWGLTHFVRRSKDRVRRILLFKFRLNLFPQPYLGRQSYLWPLQSWGVKLHYPGPFQVADQELSPELARLAEKPFIALAPSAAWPLKVWPESHFRDLIARMPQHRFLVLGGPMDEFCQHFQDDFPDRVVNLAGKLKLRESLAFVRRADALVSGDTGLLHWADSLEIPTIALLGPTAFGRPWAPTSKVLERKLPCRPCTKDGRGKCSESVYKRCMVDISPVEVENRLHQLVESRPHEVH